MRTNLLQLLTYAALSSSALVVPLAAREMGAGYEVVGLIGTAHGLAGVLGNVLFGRLGDRTDRRDLLAFGFLAACAAYASQLWANSPDALLVSRFLVGFAAGIVPAALVAYVYDIKRPLGKFTSYNAVGWLLGSLWLVALGTFASYVFRVDAVERVRGAVVAFGVYDALFLTSALCCLGAWLHARRLPSMRVHLDVPLFPARVVAANAHVYASLLLRHVGATAIWTVYPLYVVAIGGDLAMVGWLHVVNMVAQIAILRSADRWGRLGHPRVLIVLGLVTSALAFGAFALTQDPVQLLPLQLLVGVSFGALWLGCLKEVLERNVERSTATGLLNASTSLSNVLGPLLGGLVAARLGFHWVMYAGAVLTAAAVPVYLLMGSRRGLPPEPRPALVPRPVGDVAP